MEEGVIKIENELYPRRLREIPDAPQTLYIRGKLFTNEACFAIVGTRKCSDYGKEIAFSFAKELAKAGLVIVSGMARGIDSYAHKGALEAGGRTIGVLGTGLAEKAIYPKENLNLARQIIEKGGCLISEYPPETRGSRFTFPQRNRIISGMCLGVLVVEAKVGSGALITAKWARKQQRKVFAVPGSVHSINSRGCHLLIGKGARLVEKPEDILKALSLKPLPLPEAQPNIESKTTGLILNSLEKGSLHIDKIIEQTKLSPRVVSSTLSLMESDGKVKNLGANVFISTN